MAIIMILAFFAMVFIPLLPEVSLFSIALTFIGDTFVFLIHYTW